jgi:hypothetical protein
VQWRISASPAYNVAEMLAVLVAVVIETVFGKPLRIASTPASGANPRDPIVHCQREPNSRSKGAYGSYCHGAALRIEQVANMSMQSFRMGYLALTFQVVELPGVIDELVGLQT